LRLFGIELIIQAETGKEEEATEKLLRKFENGPVMSLSRAGNRTSGIPDFRSRSRSYDIGHLPD
tara:strand:+ start:1135 stop:1326 length:192 start_codon:yes stop_codon:yes gene_type:complete